MRQLGQYQKLARALSRTTIGTFIFAKSLKHTVSETIIGVSQQEETRNTPFENHRSKAGPKNYYYVHLFVMFSKRKNTQETNWIWQETETESRLWDQSLYPEATTNEVNVYWSYRLF